MKLESLPRKEQDLCGVVSKGCSRSMCRALGSFLDSTDAVQSSPYERQSVVKTLHCSGPRSAKDCKDWLVPRRGVHMRFHWHSRDVWRARTGQAECKNLGCAIPGTAAKAAAKAGAGSTSCSGPASRRSSEARAATPATTSSTTRSRTYSWAIRPCRRNSAGRASCRSTTGTRSASPHIAPCQPAMRTGGLKVHRRETSQSSCLPGPTRMPSARRHSMSCNFASPARVGSRGPKSRCWCPRSPSGSARRSRCPRREFRRALALRAGRLGSSISVSSRQSS